VRPYERRNKNLVIHGKPSQLRELKAPLDGNILVRQPDPLDHERMALG
jgi:hypothetical protein